jgi:hypothetical protein
MKLDAEFYRLPFRFDVKQLQAEVQQFKKSEWCPHPAGFKGNSSIPLVSLNGEINDLFNGPMLPTYFIDRCPYIQQVIASFDVVVGRSRLMRLDGHCEVSEHSDVNYHWYKHVRIHIPIITNPGVLFHSGSKSTRMGEGETWLLDTWNLHHVDNNSDETRIHLVIDTYGSAAFWDIVKLSERPCDTDSTPCPAEKHIPYIPGASVEIKTEKYNAPLVMYPEEVDALTIDVITDTVACTLNNKIKLARFVSILESFRHDWRALWCQYGQSEAGWPVYAGFIESTVQEVRKLNTGEDHLTLNSNRGHAVKTFLARVIYPALNTDLATDYLPQATNTGTFSSVATLSGKPVTAQATRTKTTTGISRNAACPCGSGRKYKRCHGA